MAFPPKQEAASRLRHRGQFGQSMTRRHARPPAMPGVSEMARQHGDGGEADQVVDPGQFFARPVIAIIVNVLQ